LVSGRLGEEEFREELPTQMSEQMGAEHYGEERVETAEALAELIIAEELKRARWQEAGLKARPKGDSAKVVLAARLRADTTMTVGCIAESLAMGTRGYLNHLLYRRRKLGGELTISRTDPFSGPTVTCRGGTCVHQPGYCHNWTFGEWVTLGRHCVTRTFGSRGPLLVDF
jgi:hypothetical protein